MDEFVAGRTNERPGPPGAALSALAAIVLALPFSAGRITSTSRFFGGGAPRPCRSVPSPGLFVQLVR